MSKKYTKLIAAVALMLAAFTALIVTSYAWLTLSDSPVAEGIPIAIGGGGTILIAPDVTQTVDGKVYHYPGAFKEQINFSQYKSYEYLKTSAGLSPVSTADGRHWFIPTYYSAMDEQVLSGEAVMGQIKPTTQHINDSTLLYANLPEEQLEQAREGSYIYLDFWVVSPGGDYKLRVSGGDGYNDTGSFVIGLPNVQQTQDGFQLGNDGDRVAASVRIGFLTNTNTIRDDSMHYYLQSAHYSDAYSSLRGNYEDPGIYSNDLPGDRFTIYEPNGDLHPNTVYNTLGEEILDGQYAITKPVGKDGSPISVEDRLTVQLRNHWLPEEYGLTLEQMFQTCLTGELTKNMSAQELERHFYFDYLQQQVSPYMMRGKFINRTADLYGLKSNPVTQEQLQSLGTSYATEDAIIVELEKNVPQRIRMFVWLEGQDPDCVGFTDSVRFCVGLELAGGK
ncbi:MAG: hypothetical protein E7454_06565 [Ruminococcaceae bacterium]|nr:hypothetical protein [Oscillospiraceae bacterium]